MAVPSQDATVEFIWLTIVSDFAANVVQVVNCVFFYQLSGLPGPHSLLDSDLGI